MYSSSYKVLKSPSWVVFMLHKKTKPNPKNDEHLLSPHSAICFRFIQLSIATSNQFFSHLILAHFVHDSKPTLKPIQTLKNPTYLRLGNPNLNRRRLLFFKGGKAREKKPSCIPFHFHKFPSQSTSISFLSIPPLSRSSGLSSTR
jgi:hypothetical protein